MLSLVLSMALARPNVRPIRCDVSSASGHVGQVVLKDERTARPIELKVDPIHAVRILRDRGWVEVQLLEKPSKTDAHRTYLGGQQTLILSVKTATEDVICQYMSTADLAKIRKSTNARPIEKNLDIEESGGTESTSTGSSGSSSR